jgi:aspartate carbamoyltransferase
MSDNIINTRHLLSTSNIDKRKLLSYIQLAEDFRSNLDPECPQSVHKFILQSNQFPDKTVINMFCEPSTRTNCSFQAAAIKLGCKVIALSEQESSAKKGESLEDTIKTLQYYGDAIVLRHPARGAALLAAGVSRIPIINGGDGTGEHPTQALLDVFTIYSELRKRHIELNSESRPLLTITFVGDLKNSRTVHSLIRLLTHFPNLQFVYVSPESLEMPAEIVEYVRSFNRFEQNKVKSIKDAIYNTDVLYMTRIQKERFMIEDEYREVMLASESYSLSLDTLQSAKEKMILMHPLPRLHEIPPEIDGDRRAVYFKQVENGLYMRMAILCKIFREYGH